MLACLGVLALNRAAVGADDPQPGVALTFASHTDNGSVLSGASCISRTIDLYVPAYRLFASQMWPPANFRITGVPTQWPQFVATFEGNLNQRLRSYVKFHAEGRGTFRLKVNDAVVLESSGDDLSKVVSNEVRLNKGKNAIVAEYTSPAKGESAIRLFWESKTFRARAGADDAAHS